MSKIGIWMRAYRTEHPRFWSALKSAVAAGAAVLTPEILIYTGDIARWAQDDKGGFPAPGHLGRTVVYAAIVMLTGVYNFLWNSIKDNKIVYKKEE